MKTASEVKSMPIKEVVDDPVWQEVRKSLIGNWVNNHIKNVEILKDYLWLEAYSPISVRRVLNVLVGSVHRCGYTKDQEETNQLRKDIRILWATMNGIEWDREDPKYKEGII